MLDAVELAVSLSKDDKALMKEVQLGFEIVQLLVAHNPTLIFQRVPSLLAGLSSFTCTSPAPAPFSELELLTILAHLLDACCDVDHAPVPSPTLTAALAPSLSSDSTFWLSLASRLIALANDRDLQSAALSALESLGAFAQHYLAQATRREVQTQVLTPLLLLYD